LQLANEDFEFGRSELAASGGFEFVPGGRPSNTVRVTGRRTSDSPSGSIPLLFGNLLGLSHFEPRMVSAATYIERDVVLVVDRSGSMRGSKFRELRQAIEVFVDTLDTTPVDELVGSASYNHRATEDVPLTSHLAEISTQLGRLSTRGRTSISRGMEAGRAIMDKGRSKDFVERTLIVMTDGIHNEGPEPSGVARRLADAGVQIHTITFGSGADQRRMKEVASIGGGRHYHALSSAELTAAYREIALTLGTVMTQ
jgi:Mg-chelatase subunit ChlD